MRPKFNTNPKIFHMFIFILAFVLLIDSRIEEVNDKENDTDEHVQNEWQWKCRSRDYVGQSSFVCVCDSNFCDKPEPIGLAPDDSETLVYYLTDRSKNRLTRMSTKFRRTLSQGQRSFFSWKVAEKIPITIEIDAGKTSQTIFGFGGAFTDSTGINLLKLSEKMREVLLRNYFHEEGIRYTIGRVPIASCDFSTREYSYLDVENDFELRSFALVTEDTEYKIPFIHKARDISNNNLRLFASPWSAPGWMKTNGRMKGGGRLKGPFNGPYYKTYANYFTRFFEEYEKQNVTFWGVTIQNEPSSGLDKDWGWQTLYLSNSMEKNFAEKLLVPSLKKSSASKDLKVMAWDDYRSGAFQAAQEVYGNDSAKPSVIDGLAVHWYDHSGFDVLSKTHNLRPDKFLLATEACTGYAPWQHKVLLGDWHRGCEYGHDILGSMRNWVIGWVDWNLCLDLEGGPNWVRNFVDSPIIVNSTADEFYKQPMFYFMAHFSYFVPPRSVRIDSVDGSPSVPTTFEHVAFKTPDGQRVLVVINDDAHREVELTIKDTRAKKSAVLTVTPDSILTAVWQK